MDTKMAHQCPICNTDQDDFRVTDSKLDTQSECIACDANSYQRLLWFFLITQKLLGETQSRLLHIAPEEVYHHIFSAEEKIEYWPVANNPSDYKYSSGEHINRADSTDIPFKDNWFDAVICNNLDGNSETFDVSLKEIYRTLTYEGWAILPPLNIIKRDNYLTQLKSIGFEITVTPFTEEFSAEEIETYGLPQDGEILFCIKKELALSSITPAVQTVEKSTTTSLGQKKRSLLDKIDSVVSQTNDVANSTTKEINSSTTSTVKQDFIPKGNGRVAINLIEPTNNLFEYLTPKVLPAHSAYFTKLLEETSSDGKTWVIEQGDNDTMKRWCSQFENELNQRGVRTIIVDPSAFNDNEYVEYLNLLDADYFVISQLNSITFASNDICEFLFESINAELCFVHFEMSNDHLPTLGEAFMRTQEKTIHLCFQNEFALELSAIGCTKVSLSEPLTLSDPKTTAAFVKDLFTDFEIVVH